MGTAGSKDTVSYPKPAATKTADKHGMKIVEVQKTSVNAWGSSQCKPTSVEEPEVNDNTNTATENNSDETENDTLTHQDPPSTSTRNEILETLTEVTKELDQALQTTENKSSSTYSQDLNSLSQHDLENLILQESSQKAVHSDNKSNVSNNAVTEDSAQDGNIQLNQIQEFDMEKFKRANQPQLSTQVSAEVTEKLNTSTVIAANNLHVTDNPGVTDIRYDPSEDELISIIEEGY